MKPVYWIDAFTETRYGGNPCAVVFDADDIGEEARIAFTRETGLVECAFVVSSTAADFGARYYLPTGEIPMAGHPTVATVTALIAAGLVSAPSRFTLEVGAGVMPIEVIAREGRPPLVAMTQPRPVFGRTYDPAAIAEIYGLRAVDVTGVPQTVSTGTPFCIVRLGSLVALRAARLDSAALARFKAAEDADFMAPFLHVTRGATEEGETFARLLLPPPLPAEDPFTGAATGCMAAWLFAQGWIARRFVAEQGHDLGRPGWAEVELIGPSDAIEGVRVAGAGVSVIRGDADF